MDTVYLTTPHGIAIIDIGPLKLIRPVLKALRIPEFASPVCQDHREEAMELIGTERFLESVKYRPYSARCSPVQQVCQEKMRVREIKGKDTLGRAFCRNDRIHLHKTAVIKRQGFKIRVGSPCKYSSVSYRGVLLLSRFHFDLTFQIDIFRAEDSLIDVAVQRTYGSIELWMVCNDGIRGLPILDQWDDDTVHLHELLSCLIDALSRGSAEFFILPLGKSSIVIILIDDGTSVSGGLTAIADVRSPFEAAASLQFKTLTFLITAVAGRTLLITRNQLFANVDFLTAKAVGTEILGMKREASPVPCVGGSMETDLF